MSPLASRAGSLARRIQRLRGALLAADLAAAFGGCDRSGLPDVLREPPATHRKLLTVTTRPVDLRVEALR